jgi:hypothetical protein
VDAAAWLHDLGMQRYEPASRKERDRHPMLRDLTMLALEDLGISQLSLDTGRSLRSQRQHLTDQRSRPRWNACSTMRVS